MKWRALGVAVLILTSACSGAPADRQVTIAAAADLTFALPEIAELVQEIEPSISVITAYGSSGQFLQQIVNGAPYDMFLSADVAFPDELVVRGLATQANQFTYAVGRIVVWTTRSELGTPTLQTLADPNVRKVAIANPRHAPYGRAAMAAIESAGLAEAVENKLVLGENVAQAADFVLSGSADVGIVALSLVLADPVQGRGQWTHVPEETYPRILQAGVILNRAADPEAAQLVRDVMVSERGRAILSRYGFVLDDS